jgi:uncharacterized lipoprotein YddW (UPF0748 family)
MLKGFKQTLIIPHFLTFIFSLCFVLFTLKPALTIPPPVREIRGVWLTNIDSDVLFSRRGVTEALNRLKTLNFNTIYPTVWQGGYTLYPSQVAQQYFGQSLDPTPGLQGRDILQEFYISTFYSKDKKEVIDEKSWVSKFNKILQK